jgi:hypothetical protein
VEPDIPVEHLSRQFKRSLDSGDPIRQLIEEYREVRFPADDPHCLDLERDLLNILEDNNPYSNLLVITVNLFTYRYCLNFVRDYENPNQIESRQLQVSEIGKFPVMFKLKNKDNSSNLQLGLQTGVVLDPNSGNFHAVTAPYLPHNSDSESEKTTYVRVNLRNKDLIDSNTGNLVAVMGRRVFRDEDNLAGVDMDESRQALLKLHQEIMSSESEVE